jgi:general secretion pathway protein D
MKFRKCFSNGSVFFAASLCVILLLLPSAGFAARVAGSEEPVTTIQPAQKSPGEITPAKTPTQEPTPSSAPMEKIVQGPVKSPAQNKIHAEHPKKQIPEKYVTIDFDNVDIAVFVKFISELTGKNFIIDNLVKGKVTVISPKKIPLRDVYKVFLSVLEVNGFTTVSVGDMVKVIPAASAREKSVETRLKKDSIDPEDRIVTQIITLERANPDEIKRVLDPIISKSSSVLSYPPAGMLIITDFLSNIKRLQEIVTALDVEGAGDQITYIPLQNASAGEVVKALTMIFQQRRAGLTPIRIVPDSRTNSLIVLASVADTENVRKLIDLMDKDVPRGESNIQVYRLQNSNADDLAKVLTNITKDAKTGADQRSTTSIVSKNVQIVSDKATNTLVIMAEREDYKILEGIIKKLDVPRPMVYIEALIMEVNATKSFNIGTEWRGLRDTGKISGVDTGQSAAFIGSGGAGSTTNPGGYNILSGLTTAAFPGGGVLGIIGAGITIGGVAFPNIGAVVQAYKTDSEVSILSTPQIMTIDNEEAEINVGSNVPYITRQDSTATSGTVPVNYNTYEYKDVGVILNITPHINEENFIRLKISQQVTKVTSDASSTTPTTLKRTAKTTVVVKDNDTIVIGGLVGDSTSEGTYKVPLLGDIPLLGWLFKTKSSSREKTNLYIFITSHIVRTQEDARKIFDEKRETMGDVVEGVIKLNEKNPEQKPPSRSQPAENNAPGQSAE